MKRTVLAIVCTSVLTALIMGQGKNPVPKVIRAERFEVVDGAGEVRAVLGFFVGGLVALKLGDLEGSDYASISFGSDSALIVLEVGASRISMHTSKDDAITQINCGDAKTRLSVSDRISSLRIANGVGNTITAVVDPGGFAFIKLDTIDSAPKFLR